MSESHRILAVIESLGRGGAEQQLLSLAGALRARDHQVRVVALWPPYALAAEFEASGIAVDRLDLGHRRHALQAVARLHGVVERFAPTILYSQLFFANLYTALVGTVHRLPMVTTLQSMDYEQHPANTTFLRARRRVDAWAIGSAMDARVAVSDAVGVHLGRELGFGRDFEVIPNTIDVARVRSMAAGFTEPSRPAANGAPPRLVCPARLVPAKGHMVLLDAAHRVHQTGVKFELVLGGDGPCRGEIEARIRTLDLEPVVRLAGSMGHADLMALVASADAVVMSSFVEGLPVALLEAQALGIPVVATAVGGVGEIIEHERTGLLVPPHDGTALADAMRRIISERSAAREWAQAAALAIDQFDASPIAARYEAVFDRVVGA